MISRSGCKERKFRFQVCCDYLWIVLSINTDNKRFLQSTDSKPNQLVRYSTECRKAKTELISERVSSRKVITQLVRFGFGLASQYSANLKL